MAVILSPILEMNVIKQLHVSYWFRWSGFIRYVIEVLAAALIDINWSATNIDMIDRY